MPPKKLWIAFYSVSFGILFLSPNANADDKDVLNVIVNQQLVHDSNVFKLAPEEESSDTAAAGKRSDWISTTALQLDVDKHFGRHRLAADLSQNYVKFNTFDRYDYSGQKFHLAWSGDFARDSGYGMAYDRSRTLENFAELASSRKNLVRRDSLSAYGRLRAFGEWQLVGSVAEGRTRNSGESFEVSDTDYRNVDAGVRYAPRSGNFVDLRYKYSQVDYPNRILSAISTTDNSYTQNEIRLSTMWISSYASRLDANVAVLERRHKNLDFRNFQDAAGSVQYTWRYDPKFSLIGRVFRDVGAASDSTALYAITQGVAIKPVWDATAKVRLEGRLESRYRKYQGDPLVELLRRYGFAADDRAPRKDRSQTVGVSVNYAFERNWMFATEATWERRVSTIEAEAYRSLGVSALLQYTY